MNVKKIILIDGNSLMFRAYYATAYTGNLMKNKQGLYTNAIFGFCNMFQKLQEEEHTHIFVAFDAGKKTFRHQQFESYKGTRKHLPEELAMQIPYIKKYLDIIQVKRYEMDEYEADDLIATMAIMAKENKYDQIKVITGDKDLLQLVNDPIKVFITRKGLTDLEEFTDENFYEKMNIYPHQIPDYKGLVGDASDNLPGIKGIGEKTASKLLNEYQTLEDLIANVGSLKGKTKELIETGYEMGLECKRLATLEKHIPLDFNLDDTIVKDIEMMELVKFYKDLEFESLIQRLNIVRESNAEIDLTIVEDNNFDFSKFNNAYLSIEVFENNYYNGQFLGIGLTSNHHNIFITPQGVLKNKSFQEFLLDENKVKGTFDYKKLYVVLKKNNLEIKNIQFDLLLAAYLINPSYANEDMKKVVDEFMVNDLDYDENVYGFKSKAKIPDLAIYAQHALEKTLVLESLEALVMKKIAENNQTELYNIELNLSPVLGDMELSGLKIDRQKLEEVEKDLSAKQEVVASKIYELVGFEFNINSVKQLGEILFVQMGLPSGKKNKTGYSTDSSVLEKLAPDYEIAKQIIEYRALGKIISTYLKGLFEVMNEENFVHPLYKQALTVTGRLSSVEPNIQNMPIRTELGQVIREAFISRFENGKIMGSDYSQIELRVLAHIANDQTMISMFNANIDFHKQTASNMYEVSLEEVTKEMRRAAKAINFGIIYGMSAWGLSESLAISPLEANIYINKYFDTFKEVKVYLDKTILEAKENGYTRTIFNRLRYLPELKSGNKALVGFGERTAMNSPIQGSAADIIKLAMNNVKAKIKNMKSIMIAQVHDELLFDVPPDEIETLQKIVKESMESAIKLKVSLLVEVSYGDNWLKA
jgi:DNA polymerase-1